MAAPLRKTRQEEVRAKIQSSLLVTYLMEHAAGKRKMSVTQVRAAEILLRKTLPDLSEHSGGLELGVRGRDQLVAKIMAQTGQGEAQGSS